MTTTTLSAPLSCRPPFADTLLQVCLFLPTPFTIQDVVRAVAIHCPEHVDDSPEAWEFLRANEEVRVVGLCGSVFQVVRKRDD